MQQQNTQPILSLTIAVLILIFTLVPGSAYVAMKIWFYRLNSSFRKRSAAIRETLGKEATLSETRNRPIFVGFFHPYWYEATSGLVTN